MIHVVGVGLDGAMGLSATLRQLSEQATLLVGSSRHLGYFPQHSREQFLLGKLEAAIAHIHQHLATYATAQVVVLTSGDPLFFGLGRLLLLKFAAEQLTFHPHLSSVQLAFNRVKIPWQDAKIISAHGRSLEELLSALQQGASPMAILTDGVNTPATIARLLASLDLPTQYQLWICENLGGTEEQLTASTTQPEDLTRLAQQTFAPLNVVVLQRAASVSPSLDSQPLLGILDQAFVSFPDRPGLMTKREVRTLVLAELALQPNQVIWDVGAGTGSVSIEMARLCPTSTIYAIEKTAVGFTLIQQNCQRFQVDTVLAIQGTAPDALRSLPNPDRIFIGGSGGNLNAILDTCSQHLTPGGRMVLALATLDHLTQTLNWLQNTEEPWQHHLLQVNLSRSVAVAALTRWAPLNPVTLVTLEQG